MLGFSLKIKTELFGREIGINKASGLHMADVLPNTVQQEPVMLCAFGEKLSGVLFMPQGDQLVPAVILCHGAGEFKENYFEFAEYLAHRGIAALALDMHGHGQSEGPRFHVNLKQWVADIQASVDYLAEHSKVNPQAIAAFGLSSGGTAVLETGLIEPRLRALVVLDPTVRNILPWPKNYYLHGLSLVGKIKRAFTGQDLRVSLIKGNEELPMVADLELNRRLQADPQRMAGYRSFPLPGAAQAFFVDTINRVSQITAPILIIWGKEDALDPPESGQLLYNTLRCQKRLEIIPGNGHAGHLDREREKVFALTASFILEQSKMPMNTSHTM